MAAAYPVLWHAAVAAMRRSHRERLGLSRAPMSRTASVTSLAVLRACLGTPDLDAIEQR